MKKFLTYSVVAATIAWSMGISAVLPAAAAYSAADGDVVKVTSGCTQTNKCPAVYYISGGKKYLFVNRVTYSTWASAIGDTSDKFTGLKGISQADFEAISLGGNITVRPGTSLIKFDDGATVYAVGTGAKLYKLADSAAQTALYGSATPVTIQSGFRTNYYDNGNSVATLTSSSLYPDGTLIKASTGDTYLVEGGNKRMVTTDAFTANGFKSSNVRTVSDLTAYGTGSSVTAKEAGSSPVAGAGTSTVTGSATVSLNSTSPAATTLVSGASVGGQAGAVLAKFDFSGTGIVTGLKLNKIGISGDDTLSGVYLYDGAIRLTDAGTFSNGVVSFSNPSGLFTISGTKTITVKADVAAAKSGQIIGVSINGTSAVTGVTVGGSFPVNGNLMSIASVSDLATAALGTATNVGTSVAAGTSNVTLWSNSLTIGQRSVWMKSLTLKNIGSAPDASFSNVGLYVDGVKAGSASLSNGLVVFDLNASPMTLNSGSHQIDLRGDVVDGVYRSFQFNLMTATDLGVVDSSYNVGVTVTGTIPSAPSTTNISQGTYSITTDSSFNTTQTVANASNQTLGKWIFKAYGEDLKVLTLKASTTAATSDGSTIGSTEKINNYAIYVNGQQVGSSQTESMVTSTATLTFGTGNLFTIPANTSVTVEIKGDLSFASGSKINSLTTKLVVPANQIQGTASYQTAPAAETTYNALNQLAIATGALTIAKNSTYGDQTIAPNVTAQKVGSFIITAGDADSVRITNINIQLTSSTLGFATNTSDLYISENTNKVSPQSSNNFAVDFTLQPNQSKTIDVYMTIGNLATADLGLTVISSLSLTARTGANADASVGLTAATKGQTVTVNSGSLSVINFATSTALTSRYVLGGSTIDKVAVYTIKATNAPIIVDELAFHVLNSNSSYYPVTALIVNGTSVNMVGNYATSTGMNLTIPNSYAGTQVTVKGVMNIVGQNANISGVMASTSLTYIKYHTAGGSPQTVYYGDAGLKSADFTAVASIPSVSVSKVSNLLSVGTVKLAALNLNADVAGPVNVTALQLTVATSSKVNVVSFVLKDSAGNSVSDTVNSAAGGTVTFTMSNGGYMVTNPGATLYLYGTVSAGSAWGNAGTEYVTTALSAGSNFNWIDVNGDSTGAATLTGTSIYGYSTDAINITN